ncbi:hypothetical protein [Amycolatopsis sp. lyj-346]|uniref:hypothetical protein n=1 Tax=Amycolatopsis sp. lyj-346 TaxID=2789289 RepID=UPI0039791110
MSHDEASPEDEEGSLAGLVSGICRKCEAEVVDVTPDEGQRWEEQHRSTCPRRDELPIW